MIQNVNWSAIVAHSCSCASTGLDWWKGCTICAKHGLTGRSLYVNVIRSNKTKNWLLHMLRRPHHKSLHHSFWKVIKCSLKQLLFLLWFLAQKRFFFFFLILLMYFPLVLIYSIYRFHFHCSLSSILSLITWGSIDCSDWQLPMIQTTL